MGRRVGVGWDWNPEHTRTTCVVFSAQLQSPKDRGLTVQCKHRPCADLKFEAVPLQNGSGITQHTWSCYSTTYSHGGGGICCAMYFLASAILLQFKLLEC